MLSWTPPQHTAPALAWLSDPIVLALTLLARHPFVVVLGSLLLALALGKLFPWLTADTTKAMRFRRWITAALILFSLANLALGSFIANALIYQTGQAGGATITAQHETSSVYNNKFIVEEDILIQQASGKTVTRHFSSDDFNVYPSHNRTLYPATGDQFTVRYLRHAPSAFVIVANDQSPWAQAIQPRYP